MIARIFQWLAGGALDRVLSTVDTKIKSDVDKEKLKTDLIMKHYETKASIMRAGGFWLMLIFAAPLALWWATICIYSIFWCVGCAYPQEWSIAALPAPLDEWAGMIILSIFGVIGVSKLKS
jgi:hypothetical protein